MSNVSWPLLVILSENNHPIKRPIIVSIIPIRDLQGEGFISPYSEQQLTTSGVVTGVLRKGFFLQTPNVQWDGKGSNAIFVYSPEWTATLGAEIEVTGEVVDFIKHDTARPVTQLHLEQVRVKSTDGPDISPIEFTQKFLPEQQEELALLLNSLEGMLIKIDRGQTFISPSNRYGDYVLALDAERVDDSALRSEQGGAIVELSDSLRWFPGFRITNYNHAPRLNVGSKLASVLSGPLNYRVDSYQVSVSDPFEIDANFISLTKSSLVAEDGALTVMTLNCFNLDPHIESEALVSNPLQDIDDDWGEGRFHTLAQAVVLQANSPDIIALQEIQDNDGAELTEVVDASVTYSLLIETIEELSGIRYSWIDVPPELGADGGQPGGNIRNGYLYNPERVELDQKSVRVLGRNYACFDDSRKPLVCEFIEKSSGKRLAIINVHLASKRHQESVFALQNPGFDAKEEVRIQQGKVVAGESDRLDERGVEFYITGDFNDTEHSRTLQEIVGDDKANLVLDLPKDDRYDYNHRGKLQVLMHGVVPKSMQESGRTEYEIIHGNELIGVVPGEDSDKPSDHAYVIAKLRLV